MNAEQMVHYFLKRAEKAEARHAKAVALLREARSDLRYLNALPGEHGQDAGLLERINTYLAACDGKEGGG